MTRFFSGKGQQGPNAANRASLYDATMASVSQGSASGAAPKMGRVARALGIGSDAVVLPETVKVMPTVRPVVPSRLNDRFGPPRRVSPSRFDFAKGIDTITDIRQGLIDRGLPPRIADAFIMNMQDESGFDSGINERVPKVPGSRGGFGLLQWTGDRRKALEKFAEDRGEWVNDADTQLDFLASELNGSESRAYEAMLAAPNTGSAAVTIMNRFLRPDQSERPRRKREYLNSQDLPESPPIPSPAIREPDPTRFAPEVRPDASQPTVPMLRWTLQNSQLDEAQRAEILREIKRRQGNPDFRQSGPILPPR